MSDHADTIRRALQRLPEAEAIVALTPMPGGSGGPPPTRRGEALMALECLVAERQQAIDERDAYKEQALSEGRLADDRLGIANEVAKKLVDSEARCEQAIDALRRIAKTKEVAFIGLQQKSRPTRDAEIARAALLNLGETE